MNRELRKLTTRDMLSEIKRRNRLISKLNRRRALLLQKVAEVEADISRNGGEIKAGALRAVGGKRPRNEMALPEAMAKVMSASKPMSVAQIEEAVTKIGYRSTSTTFKTIIFQALAKDKRFKKVARGQYALK